MGLKIKARKLLSFTDNRQDASLQAGHFNDFAETGLLRAALHQAVHHAGSEGLTHDKLSHAVFEVLNLPFEDYAVDPTLKFAAKDDTKQVLRDLACLQTIPGSSTWLAHQPSKSGAGGPADP